MSAHSSKKINISIMFPFIVFILFFSTMIWQKYKSSLEISPTPPSITTEGASSVTLFFGDEGTYLAREAREIGSCDDPNSCLKSVLDELLNGPVGEFEETIPDGVNIDTVSIEGEIATIDFNQAFLEAMLSGSSAEMLAVYSIVNTVVVNFPEIKKVKLNVHGKSDVVLKHLDISEPLTPDFSLEKERKPHSEKAFGGRADTKQGEIK